LVWRPRPPGLIFSAEPLTAAGLSIEARLRAAFELSPTILAITTAGEGRLLEVN
jgi:hypothetical protein